MIKHIARQFLLEIGIPTNLSGFELLECAIVFCKQNGCKNMTNYAYPVIAAQKNMGAAQTERNIRHAIEQAYNRGKLQRLNRIFGTDLCNKRLKPTNKEVISLGVLYIDKKLEELSILSNERQHSSAVR